MPLRGKHIDAGWAQGSLVVLTDEFIIRDLGFNDSDYFYRRWHADVVDIDHARRTTTIFFPRLPSITMMGRKGERKVFHG